MCNVQIVCLMSPVIYLFCKVARGVFHLSLCLSSGNLVLYPSLEAEPPFVNDSLMITPDCDSKQSSAVLGLFSIHVE